MRVIFVFTCLLLIGCGAREEIVVSEFSLAHQGWDTLTVSVGFASKTVLSGMSPVSQDSTRIVAFNASYDTLYAGSDSIFSIPDADLGNEEKLLVEVCGQVKQVVVCEQALTSASPKRVSTDPEIKYPLRKKVFEGEYKLPFIVERLEGETWTQVKPSSSLQGYMKAYVQGKEEESILLPFTQTRGDFNLAYKNNYKDFKFYLDSALLDEQEANVIFDVYVDLEGIAESVGSVSKDIKVKTDEEHKEDLALMVEEAADWMVEHLTPFLRRKKNTVYIDQWTYNTFKKMYAVDMEVEWRGSMFNRSRYSLAGLLEVYEEGNRATFKLKDGNRRALQRWDSSVNGNVLTLFNSEDELMARQQAYQRGHFQERDGLVVIEAEHFESSRTYRNQSWGVSSRVQGFRGSGAVVVAPDRGVRIRSRYNKRSPELTYEVDFTETGTYFVWLRVWADDNNSNSVHVGLNGEANRSSSYIGTEDYGRWVWTRRQQDSDDFASIRITSRGTKKINLWMREDGLYVDRIILTKDRAFSPGGSGPDESMR